MKLNRETIRIYFSMVAVIFLSAILVMLAQDYLFVIPIPYNCLAVAIALSLISSFGLLPLLSRHRQRSDRALQAVGIANEGYWLTNRTGRFIDVNDGYCRLVGYQPAELLTRHISEMEIDLMPGEAEQRMQRLLSQGHDKFEARHRHKDGHGIDVEISMSCVDAENIIGFVRNIGEKKEKERRTHLLTQIYAALFHTNRALWESTTEDELFDNICRVAVDHGGMALVWIGRLDAESDMIKPVASYGEGQGHIEGIALEWQADRPGGGPTATAYREGHSIFIQDFCTDPMTAPSHERAKHYGWGASAALCVRRGGKSYAVISYYRYDTHSFTQEIVDLLNEVAKDIGHALDRFDIRKERAQAIRFIEESAGRYHRIIGTSLDGFWMVDTEGKLLEVNDVYLKRSGYLREELLGLHIQDLDTTMDNHQVRELLRQMENTGHAIYEAKHRAKDGSMWPVEISAGFIDQEGGGRFFGFIRDISERRKAEEEMLIAATVFESHEAMFVTDAERNIVRANNAFSTATGYGLDEVVGKNPRILQSGLHNDEFYREMWAKIHRDGSWRGEIVDRRKDGETYPTWMTISCVKNSLAAVTHYVASFTDISDYKSAQEKIQALAFYDQLTGLPNRLMLLERLERALAASARHSHFGAVLYLDLDDFKTINDTVGHDCGDEVLRETAKRLRATVRQEDTTARLGGDEFVVLLEDISPDKEHAATHAKVVGDKLLDTLARTYRIRGNEYLGSVSIGATLFCGQHEGVHELLKRADLAMYEAKKMGRNTLRFFDPVMQEALERRMRLEFDLRRALEADELRLYYQKMVESNGRTVGAEVLLRWDHPKRGIVPPLDFIPLAEDTGLVIPIGRWVFEQSCRTLRSWQDKEGYEHLMLSVNISAREFARDDFVDQVSETLRRIGVDPSLLSLEITESLLMENINEFIDKMQQLQDLGLSFSLDDFGTGYSSLSYLKRLPIKRLKIDKSFVNDLGQDKNDEAIAQTIIQMSKTLGMDVVAEGVETRMQSEMLKRFGCHIYQGYLYGKPVELEQFEREMS